MRIELIISAKKQQLGFINGTPGNVQFTCQIVRVPKKVYGILPSCPILISLIPVSPY